MIKAVAANFAALAATTVTSTGVTAVNGTVGVHPGTSITGFPPGTSQGCHSADEAARKAQQDAKSVYDVLSARNVTEDLTGKDLGGMKLKPGVYSFSSSAQLTGKLVLEGDGAFTFLIASTLTTAEKAVVESRGNAKVSWVVGSSATLGTGTEFVGDIYAKQSITLVTGSKVKGKLAALNGAVTLDTANVINQSLFIRDGVSQ